MVCLCLLQAFKCRYCSDVFWTDATYRDHVLAIHNIDPANRVSCTHCGKTYTSKQHMRFHLRTVHGEGKPVVCPVCDKRGFTNQTQYSSHVKKCRDEVAAMKGAESGGATKTKQKAKK